MWRQLKKVAQDVGLKEAMDLFGYSEDSVIDLVDLDRRYMQLGQQISQDNRDLEEEYYQKYRADPLYKDTDEYKNRYKQDPKYLDIFKRRDDISNADVLLKEKAKIQRKEMENELNQMTRPFGERDSIKGLPQDAKLEESVSWWIDQQKYDLVAEYDRDRWDTITYDIKILAPKTDKTEDVGRVDRWGDKQHYRVDRSVVDADGNITNDEYVDYGEYLHGRESSSSTIWRGLSGGEFWQAVKNGYFASSGMLNVGSEQDTCFATNKGLAFSYAGGFAPWYAAPTFEFPSYVIEMRRPSNTVEKYENLNEVEVPGKIPIDYVDKVYEVKLASQRAGSMEVIYEKQNKRVTQGGGSGSHNDFVVRELPESEWKLK